MRSGPTPFSSFVLWALLASLLSSVTVAVDLSHKHTNLGQLGVQLDYNLAKYGITKPATVAVRAKTPKKGGNSQAFTSTSMVAGSRGSKQYVWSSHLKCKNPVSVIKDGELVEMLFRAWDEFQHNAVLYGFTSGLPTAMTVMAFDHEVLLSTSIKAKAFTMSYPYTPVAKLLNECRVNWEHGSPVAVGVNTRQHFNNGACGEIATSHQFFLSRPGPAITNVNQAGETLRAINARQVTLTQAFHETGAKILKLIPPCQSEEFVSLFLFYCLLLLLVSFLLALIAYQPLTVPLGMQRIYCPVWHKLYRCCNKEVRLWRESVCISWWGCAGVSQAGKLVPHCSLTGRHSKNPKKQFVFYDTS